MTASMLPSPLLRPGGRNCCSFAILMISATSSPRTSSTLTPLSPSTRAGACLAPRARPPRPPPPPRGPLRVLPGGDAGGDGDGDAHGDAVRHLDTVRAEIRRQGLAVCARKVVASCTTPRRGLRGRGARASPAATLAATVTASCTTPRHSGGWRNAGRVRFRNTTFRKSLAQTISFCETLWLAKRIVVVSGAKRCGSGV